MRVAILLCDSAREVSGKLFVAGGGWTMLHTGGKPCAMALGILVSAPHGQHRFSVALLDAAGAEAASRQGSFALRHDVEGETTAALALTFEGLDLAPGRWTWELRIDGRTAARAPFTVAEGRAGTTNPAGSPTLVLGEPPAAPIGEPAQTVAELQDPAYTEADFVAELERICASIRPAVL